jgi:hypothetical protein
MCYNLFTQFEEKHFRKDNPMKKTLSLILAICTILSICSFSVAAAPEGTAISSAAEFAAMAADGKYYLASDITLDASYAEVFKGTLDGNGKTVTVSAPMFTAIDSATIKNLNVEGAIAYTVAAGEIAPDAAAVATKAIGNVTFDNIVNKASITGATYAAGIVAYVSGGTVTVTNCVNYGDINCTNSYEGHSYYNGGIVARFGEDNSTAANDNIIITGCTNYGNVTGNGPAVGGILGYLVGGTEIKDCVNYGTILGMNNKAGGIFGTSIINTEYVCAINIENCINYGDVASSKVVAGIAARLGRAKQMEGRTYRVTNCINYGDINAYTTITYEDKVSLYMGGIVGYAYGGTLTPANGVSNCVNLGKINADNSHLPNAKSSLYVGGIVAYVNAANYICKNNVNAAEIAINGKVTGVGNIIYNKKLDGAEAETNNYSIKAVETATDSFTTIVTADQIASGEIAYLINEAAGATIYYQAIGTDKAPVFEAAEDGSNTILKNADGTFANPVKEPEVTEPETTEPVTPPTTGDSTVIFAVIAVISILGVAVVAKRREF